MDDDDCTCFIPEYKYPVYPSTCIAHSRSRSMCSTAACCNCTFPSCLYRASATLGNSVRCKILGTSALLSKPPIDLCVCVNVLDVCGSLLGWGGSGSRNQKVWGPGVSAVGAREQPGRGTRNQQPAAAAGAGGVSQQRGQEEGSWMKLRREIQAHVEVLEK